MNAIAGLPIWLWLVLIAVLAWLSYSLGYERQLRRDENSLQWSTPGQILAAIGGAP